MKMKKGLVIGVGGQGILLFTRILGEACIKEDVPIILSEVHGMAQRGGTVESYISIYGKSPYVSEGEGDFLIGLEPIEALRFINRVKKDALLLINTTPVLPPSVKDGLEPMPDLDAYFNQIKSYFPKIYFISGEEIAKKLGSSKVINVAMLGASVALNIFPISKETFKSVIVQIFPENLQKLNLEAFEMGYNAVSI